MTASPMSAVEQRLAAAGITVPELVIPLGAYVPFTLAPLAPTGSLVFVSGQVPVAAGKPIATGKLGAGVSIETGRTAARQCALNIIAVLKAAAGGNLDRVARIQRLGGFVAATPDFVDAPQVLNGASELMVLAFGEAGRHARAAVGVASLPLDVPVEVECVAALT